MMNAKLIESQNLQSDDTNSVASILSQILTELKQVKDDVSKLKGYAISMQPKSAHPNTLKPKANQPKYNAEHHTFEPKPHKMPIKWQNASPFTKEKSVKKAQAKKLTPQPVKKPLIGKKEEEKKPYELDAKTSFNTERGPEPLSQSINDDYLKKSCFPLGKM